MAHSISAKKRIRQNARRRIINRARKSALKTQLRKFEDALHAKDVSAASAELVLAQKALDRVASKGTIHANEAARRKSRMRQKLNALQKQ